MKKITAPILILLVIFGSVIESSFGKEPGEKNSSIPTYGNWRTFTKKDGLPDDKIHCVRVDGDRIWVGTNNGLALFEGGIWKTISVEDGLAHQVVLSIDISEFTGDVWIATMGGLSVWSAGSINSFTQFNSGLPNDVVYSVVCDGKDVWVATGGGAGRYDTFSEGWMIYTEKNAPMHEPWTYNVCIGDERIYIAAWGGGVIEYNKLTESFRDYTDPDGEMEIDLFPDDGLVHDITTGISYANNVLWIGTYFGLSRYDGTHWKGYYDHDSGLPSNFINFVEANEDIVWLCTDKGLSSFNSQDWITYQKDVKEGTLTYTSEKGSNVVKATSGIAHNYVNGVDFHDNEIWVATSSGLSHGTRIK